MRWRGASRNDRKTLAAKSSGGQAVFAVPDEADSKPAVENDGSSLWNGGAGHDTFSFIEEDFRPFARRREITTARTTYSNTQPTTTVQTNYDFLKIDSIDESDEKKDNIKTKTNSGYRRKKYIERIPGRLKRLQSTAKLSVERIDFQTRGRNPRLEIQAEEKKIDTPGFGDFPAFGGFSGNNFGDFGPGPAAFDIPKEDFVDPDEVKPTTHVPEALKHDHTYTDHYVPPADASNLYVHDPWKDIHESHTVEYKPKPYSPPSSQYSEQSQSYRPEKPSYVAEKPYISQKPVYSPPKPTYIPPKPKPTFVYMKPNYRPPIGDGHSGYEKPVHYSKPSYDHKPIQIEPVHHHQDLSYHEEPYAYQKPMEYEPEKLHFSKPTYHEQPVHHSVHFSEPSYHTKPEKVHFSKPTYHEEPIHHSVHHEEPSYHNDPFKIPVVHHDDFNIGSGGFAAFDDFKGEFDFDHDHKDPHGIKYHDDFHPARKPVHKFNNKRPYNTKLNIHETKPFFGGELHDGPYKHHGGDFSFHHGPYHGKELAAGKVEQAADVPFDLSDDRPESSRGFQGKAQIIIK